MTGKIYGVGVGPGDPELLTLKAQRLMRSADVIAIPGKDPGSCTAYKIAVQAVPEIREKKTVPVVFPMTKDERILEKSHEEGAERIASFLSEGKDVVFLTLGDPTVYSTYLYLHKKLKSRGFRSEIVSGVPSFCAVAARLGISLGEKSDSIHILPGSYPDTEGAALSGTKIFMKSGSQIGAVKKALLEQGLHAVMVENCGMEGERIFSGTETIPEEAGYYSLIIAREHEEA